MGVVQSIEHRTADYSEKSKDEHKEQQVANSRWTTSSAPNLSVQKQAPVRLSAQTVLLGEEIVGAIASFLGHIEIVVLQRVCQGFRQALNRDCIWQQLLRHQHHVMRPFVSSGGEIMSWRESYFHHAHSNLTCTLLLRSNNNNSGSNNGSNSGNNSGSNSNNVSNYSNSTGIDNSSSNNNDNNFCNFSYWITLCNHSKHARIVLPLPVSNASGGQTCLWHRFFELYVRQSEPINGEEMESRWERAQSLIAGIPVLRTASNTKRLSCEMILEHKLKHRIPFTIKQQQQQQQNHHQQQQTVSASGGSNTGTDKISNAGSLLEEFLCLEPGSFVRSAEVSIGQLEAQELLFKRYASGCETERVFAQKLDKHGELSVQAELNRSMFVPYDFESRLLADYAKSNTNEQQPLIVYPWLKRCLVSNVVIVRAPHGL